MLFLLLGALQVDLLAATKEKMAISGDSSCATNEDGDVVVCARRRKETAPTKDGDSFKDRFWKGDDKKFNYSLEGGGSISGGGPRNSLGAGLAIPLGK